MCKIYCLTKIVYCVTQLYEEMTVLQHTQDVSGIRKGTNLMIQDCIKYASLETLQDDKYNLYI